MAALTPAYGSNSSLHLAFETTPGTIAASPKPKKLSFVSEDVKETQAQIASESLSGDPNPLDTVGGRIDVAGPISFEAGLTSTGLLWKWILSNLATTGSADPWSHKSKLLAGDALTATLDVLFDLATDRYKRTLGAAVDSVTVDVSDTGMLRHNLTISGFQQSNLTTLMSGTVTDMSGEAKLHHGQIAATDLIIDSAITNLQSVSMTINLNLYKDLYAIAGGSVRQGLGRQRASITGTINAYLTDNTLWALLATGGYHDVSVKWTETAPDHWFKLRLPRVFLPRTSPSANGPGPVILNFGLSASKDPTQASAIVAETSNGDDGDPAYAT